MTEATTLLALMRSYFDGLDAAIVRSFLDTFDWSMPRRRLVPNALPCLPYLDGLPADGSTAAGSLVAHVARHRSAFRWGQTYTAADFGQSFIDNYGWLEVFGTRGHFAHDGVAAGLLLLGPHTDYPDHHHVAEEIYIPLTGDAEWRKGDGGYLLKHAGEIVHHPSNVSHAMRTGQAPLLAIYLWRGGPLAQKSIVAPAGIRKS